MELEIKSVIEYARELADGGMSRAELGRNLHETLPEINTSLSSEELRGFIDKVLDEVFPVEKTG